METTVYPETSVSNY